MNRAAKNVKYCFFIIFLKVLNTPYIWSCFDYVIYGTKNFKDEVDDDDNRVHKHDKKGTVSMYSSKHDDNSSKFYIMWADGANWLDDSEQYHTVFG